MVAKLINMSKLILIISCFFLISAANVESIYTHSVKTIEGVNKPLMNYQGKKILVITLPLQQNSSNDSLLHSLDSLGSVHSSSLVIIAVPAYEDGYTPAIKDSLKLWYRSILSMDIVVTEGYMTRKTSGNSQHPLFKWLTDKNRNNHFDRDVTGPRNKFIISTTGELIGVLGAQTKLRSSIINNLLQ
jgi:glutathione peroxidase